LHRSRVNPRGRVRQWRSIAAHDVIRTAAAVSAAVIAVMIVKAQAPSAVPPTRRGTSDGVPTAHLNYQPGRLPNLVSVALADTIMARYPDYRDAYWKPWTYVHGYVFLAFERLYRDTGDRKYLDFIRRYIDSFVDEQGGFTASKLDNLDDLMTGNAIVGLYERTGEDRYRIAATRFLRALDDYPRSSDGQFWHGKRAANMWIDGIFMGQMFVIRYGHSIGESGSCWDEATRQITVFAKHAQKGDSGLYYHAWTEQAPKPDWADPKTGLSPEVWSEGLGWYALVIPETLAVLPKDHPRRAAVEDIFRRLAAGLKRTQDPETGGWYMIVDQRGKPGNWIDPSGTAMFVYSLRRGIELGLLDADEYGPVAKRGYASLLQFVKVNDRGLVDLTGGGDGISIKKDFAAYVGVPRRVNAKETVAGVLWASEIMERSRLQRR